MSRLDHERFVDLALLRRIARVELDHADAAAGLGGGASAARIDRAMLRQVARLELAHADRVAAVQAREAATADRMARLIAECMAPVFRRADVELVETRTGGDA